MELGIHIVNFTVPGAPSTIAAAVGDMVAAAEDIGVTHISVMDHWFQMEMMGSAAMEMLESYTTLGYIAARTRKARLGVLVTGVTYRHPGLLAKIVTTLDVLSGGRAELGIGAAWYEREHKGLGVPFPPVSERYERLEETLQICLQMWSDESGPYQGKHYHLAETLCVPRPIQKPHPPILIGGGGEKKTLRLVAKYAGACNLFTQLGPDGVSRKLDVLRGHCEVVGRDYAKIQKTIIAMGPPPSGDGRDFLKEMEPYAAMGIDMVIVVPSGQDPVGSVRGMERVAPQLAGMKGGLRAAGDSRENSRTAG
jgi:F420-dependent oxidoreductase-like protein